MMMMMMMMMTMAGVDVAAEMAVVVVVAVLPTIQFFVHSFSIVITSKPPTIAKIEDSNNIKTLARQRNNDKEGEYVIC